MRVSRIVAWLAVAGLGLGSPASGAPPGPPSAPPEFSLPTAEGSPGAVTFSHARHLARVPKCSTCHMRDFALKRGGSGPITVRALRAGRYCGACHDGKTEVGGAVVFSLDECDRCHR